MSKNSILVIFIVIILFLVYENKKESFSNSIYPLNYNYNKLTSNSSPPWVIKQKKLSKIENGLYKIVKMINNETNRTYFIGSIDNVTINDLDKVNQNYIIELFLYEKNEDYTLKIVVDFTVDNYNNITINTITRGNAMKYDYNYLDLKEKPSKTTCLLDKLENPIIKGFNDITLPYSLYEGKRKTLTSKVNPKDYYQDFIPLLVEKDIQYLKEVENTELAKNTKCLKDKSFWDSNGIINKNPEVFVREETPLQPKFNTSIMKNLSDKKENSWLFEPTRVEIDHNY